MPQHHYNHCDSNCYRHMLGVFCWFVQCILGRRQRCRGRPKIVCAESDQTAEFVWITCLLSLRGRFCLPPCLPCFPSKRLRVVIVSPKYDLCGSALAVALRVCVYWCVCVGVCVCAREKKERARARVLWGSCSPSYVPALFAPVATRTQHVRRKGPPYETVEESEHV